MVPRARPFQPTPNRNRSSSVRRHSTPKRTYEVQTHRSASAKRQSRKPRIRPGRRPDTLSGKADLLHLRHSTGRRARRTRAPGAASVFDDALGRLPGAARRRLGPCRRVVALAAAGAVCPAHDVARHRRIFRGSICLVLTSDLYDERDYVRDYAEFKRLAGSRGVSSTD